MKFAIFIISVILVLGGIISFTYQQEVKSVFRYPIESETYSTSTATLVSFHPPATSNNGLHIPIFIYHSIRTYIDGESYEQDTYDITPELFEQQLKYLNDNGYTAINLDQLVSMVNRGSTGGILKPVVLTFDDGVQNQYQYAFPLLKKYSIRGVFYVFSHAMDANPHFMTWAELKEMDSMGMEIESHSVTHPYINKLTPEELHTELADSKKAIEEHLGKPVHHFAAPFGFVDDAVSAEAKKDGYVTARAIAGPQPITENHLLHLHGTLVSDSFERFVSELKY